jgi:hypothetical protein
MRMIRITSFLVSRTDRGVWPLRCKYIRKYITAFQSVNLAGKNHERPSAVVIEGRCQDSDRLLCGGNRDTIAFLASPLVRRPSSAIWRAETLLWRRTHHCRRRIIVMGPIPGRPESCPGAMTIPLPPLEYTFDFLHLFGCQRA